MNEDGSIVEEPTNPMLETLKSKEPELYSNIQSIYKTCLGKSKIKICICFILVITDMMHFSFQFSQMEMRAIQLLSWFHVSNMREKRYKIRLKRFDIPSLTLNFAILCPGYAILDYFILCFRLD